MRPMPAFDWLIFLTTAYPLVRAWRANRDTSLFHAVHWAIAAWAAWGWAGLSAPTEAADRTRNLYLALCLTGCAGVAVLGARRPGVGAWNLVVAGLLAVLLLPLAEGVVRSEEWHLDGIRLFFLAATVAVGIINYLPTRLGPAALLLAVVCVWVMGGFGLDAQPIWLRARWLIVLVPWVALIGIRRVPPASPFDPLWLDFRDRYGLVWGQRLREQFNHSAAHANWPVRLRWRGLQHIDKGAPPDLAPPTATLLALMQRFVPDRRHQ